jgi:hypothetical protein
MPALFPTLQPDEPFFSGVSRYAELMGIGGSEALVDHLYGTVDPFGDVTREFPGFLRLFCARLPPRCLYTPSHLIAWHTPVPYYAPFAPAAQLRGVIQAMLNNPPANQRDPNPFMDDRTSRYVPSPHLRFCPECVAAV